MRNINPLRLSGTEYEDILANWSNRHSPTDPFSGHFLITFVTNTNQIENINISYNTTRELFESEQVSNYTGDLRNLFSVLNNKRVASFLNGELKHNTPLTLDLIKEVNRLLMFGSIDQHRYEDNGERAGEFKKHDYCVGSMSVGSLPGDVPEDLQTVCETIEQIRGKDPLKVASVFQCEFEYVHPFADGNGRTGRWLTNYLLVQLGHPPLCFYRNERQSYFDALEYFDKTANYDKMFSYLKAETIRSAQALRELL